MAAPAQEQTDVVVGDKTFRIVSELGKGGQATVKKAYDLTSRKKVALKIMWKEFDNNRQKERMLHNVKIEITAMRNLRHPNIIQLYGYDLSSTYNERECIVLVQELAKSGELFEYVQHTGGFEDLLAKYIFKQLMTGLKACHDNGIAHRDLKPENILLDKKYNVKIADFGFVNFFSVNGETRRMRTIKGTRMYMAPEMWTGEAYTQGVDIWAMGVVLFVMLKAKLPFRKAVPQDWHFAQLQNDRYPMFWAAHERRFQFPPIVKPLVEGMLCTNPDNRWTADDCLNCDWMTNGELLADEDFRRCMSERKERIDNVRKQSREADSKTTTGDRLEGMKNGEGPSRAIGEVKDGVVVFEATDVLSNDIRDKLQAAETVEALQAVFVQMAEAQSNFNELSNCEVLEPAVENLWQCETVDEIQQCVGVDETMATAMLTAMSVTQSDRPWTPMFQQLMQLEQQHPLPIFDKWVRPALFSFDTMLGYGILCVILADFVEGKGEMEIDAEKSTIELTFETEKVHEVPTDDTLENFEEVTVDVVLKILFSLYRVVQTDENGDEVLQHHKLLVQQVSQDFSAQDDFKWIVNEIAKIDDFIVARVDNDVI